MPSAGQTIEKRLQRIELWLREKLLNELASLAKYQVLSEEQSATARQLLVRLFWQEHAAGLGFMTTFNKLPEDFKIMVRDSFLAAESRRRGRKTSG